MPPDARFAFPSRRDATAYLASCIGTAAAFIVTVVVVNSLSPSIAWRLAAFLPALLLLMINVVLFRRAARAAGARPGAWSWLSLGGGYAWYAASARRKEPHE